jgi:hypothetical protein
MEGVDIGRETGRKIQRGTGRGEETEGRDIVKETEGKNRGGADTGYDTEGKRH